MAVFQRSAVDNAGNVMPLASVEVRDQVTSTLVQLYSNYALSSTIGNPILADNEGFFRFYVAPGRYRIEASLGGQSRVWEDEVLGLIDGTGVQHARTAAEIAAGVTPTYYHFEPGDIRRYGAVAGTNCTLAIQRAIDSTHGVIVRGALAIYDCAGLTQDTDGQSFHFYEGAQLRKNANGEVLTCTGHDVEFVSLRIEGLGATYTGTGLSLAGNRNTLTNCSVVSTASTALVVTGNTLQILGNRSQYSSLDTGANAYDIVVGVAGVATLYHRIMNIYTGQAFGGIRFIDCGGHSVIGGQFGKLFVDQSGSPPAGINGGMYTSNRILGNVTVETSNAVFTANQFGSITITLGAATSGISIDASNSFQGGTPTVVNNGNSDNYWAYVSSAGIIHNLGSEIPNNLGYGLKQLSGALGAQLAMSGSNVLFLSNSVSASGIILNQAGGGTINCDVNSVRSASFDASATAGHTRFLVYDVDNGTLERVSVGIADSGGSGFKLLRIPN